MENTPEQKKILQLALEAWIFKMENKLTLRRHVERVHPSEREQVKTQIAEAKRMLASLNK